VRAILLALTLLVGGCSSQHVEFSNGRCFIDGRVATVAEVEAKQAAISERILARQPLFVIVTLLIVALAGASHVEKLLLILGTRGSAARGLGERLRLAVDRYRQKPVRYFAIVAGTLSLLGLAGGFYVYLDADKRASERALGLLQFCQLAQRTTEAQGILAEQRRNLAAIESTAGNIRALVDKLPPEEQRKAKEIVDRINAELARQGKLVTDSMQRTDESLRAVQAHNAVLERGLSTLEAAFLSLKGLPAETHGIGDQLKRVDGRLGALDGRLEGADAKLAALATEVKALAARPPRECPACVCQPASSPSPPPVAPSTTVAR